ncbi:MAG TPA: MATE family efflux transporter [Bacteroidia bacterium]|nr:MATE family efflux transporter [Bacteroidia bacterium]
MQFSYKNILSIALPLVFSGFGQSIIYVTDILFLGRLGEVALGASAIAGLLYASLMMIGFGISSGLQVIIAQKVGEGKEKETSDYLLNGIFIQGLIAIFFSIMYLLFHSSILKLFVHNENVLVATDNFMFIRILGLLPYFLFYAYRSYYLGIGQTKIISSVIIVMTVLNLILNPILIYGYENIVPAMNYVGSAWASVISEILGMFLIMLFYAIRRNSFKFISKIKKEYCREIIVLSYPLIFQHFISVFSWFLFFVFIEKMGARELAISNVVRAVYVVIMSPILAFSHSTVTITGQLFGANDFQNIQKTVWKIVVLAIVFTLPFSLLSFFYPEILMKIFTNDNQLIEGGKVIMKIIAFAIIYFALSMPWISAVTGIGDTSKALLIESISFVVYIVTSFLFVFVFKWNLTLVWLNEFVYFSCIFLLSYVFFNNKIKKVMGII